MTVQWCARLAPLAVALVTACSEPAQERRSDASAAASADTTAARTVELSLPGVKVEVPTTFVVLDPERTEQLRNAALAHDRSAQVRIEGRRSPVSMLDGSVYVQRGEIARAESPALTVRQALEGAAAEMKAVIVNGGMELTKFETTSKDDTVETCVHARIGRQDVAIEVRMCSLMYAISSERFHGLSVNCMARVELADALCGPVLATRRFEPASRLSFDSELPRFEAPPPVPLSFVGRAEVGGIAFGSSAKAFRSACKKSGYLADAFEWDKEPALTRRWVAEGRVAQCSGMPWSDPSTRNDELGKIVQVNALFDSDKLTSASLFVAATLDVVGARLLSAYPMTANQLGRTIHLINAAAAADEIVSVGVGPSAVEGSQTTVTFLSKRGMDAAPLPANP